MKHGVLLLPDGKVHWCPLVSQSVVAEIAECGATTSGYTEELVDGSIEKHLKAACGACCKLLYNRGMYGRD